jgi:glutathione S-transferase
MAETRLVISSKNYSSWSLRGWLLAKWSGIDFVEEVASPDDPDVRAELLLRSSSILVPCLMHQGRAVWDTLAIAEYLNEIRPDAGLLPDDQTARARCRSISGEMHSGFVALRSALPMNLKARKPGFVIWSEARADIDRIVKIWDDCLSTWHGPYLFGEHLTVADAMYAPVCTRFVTYGVALSGASAAYCERILALPAMVEWIAEATAEPEAVPELDMEF